MKTLKLEEWSFTSFSPFLIFHTSSPPPPSSRLPSLPSIGQRPADLKYLTVDPRQSSASVVNQTCLHFEKVAAFRSLASYSLEEVVGGWRSHVHQIAG